MQLMNFMSYCARKEKRSLLKGFSSLAWQLQTDTAKN